MTPQEIKMIARQVAKAIIELQTEKALLSQNEAYRRYGRTSVVKLVSSGRIEGKKKGNRTMYNRKQLDSILL